MISQSLLIFFNINVTTLFGACPYKYLIEYNEQCPVYLHVRFAMSHLQSGVGIDITIGVTSSTQTFAVDDECQNTHINR